MNWTKLLEDEIEIAYRTTAALLDKVDRGSLDWKPASGSNWMTTGQLLRHIGSACGAPCRGFVLGDWGLPPGKTLADLTTEEMMPPAEKLPAVASVREAEKLLAEDKATAPDAISQAGEHELAAREVALPWAPANAAMPLGRHLLRVVQHLERHKTQLVLLPQAPGKICRYDRFVGLLSD